MPVRPLLRSTLGLAAIASALALPLAAEPQYPKPQGLVTDTAGILDQGTRQALENRLLDIERQTQAQVAVVTIPSLEGISVEEYAVELYQRWGIGQKGKDNGVLVLVALNDRKMRIEVGYGLEGTIPDGAAGSIIRSHMAPHFKQGNYAAGITEAVEVIAGRLGVSSHAPTAPPPDEGQYGFDRGRSGFSLGSLVMIGLLSVIVSPLFAGFVGFIAASFLGLGIPAAFFVGIVCAIVSAILRGMGGGRGGYGGWGGYGGGGGWGGFGGGGGGFGGFGGGSSGGGGASGSW
jgi:uncharacterized protein